MSAVPATWSPISPSKAEKPTSNSKQNLPSVRYSPGYMMTGRVRLRAGERPPSNGVVIRVAKMPNVTFTFEVFDGTIPFEATEDKSSRELELRENH